LWCLAGFFAASLNAVTLSVCGHSSNKAFQRSFEWFCSSRFLQFLVTIVAPYILLIVWQNAVIPAQMYRWVDLSPLPLSSSPISN
jgi:hypothetical protein